jgi:putative colanic acid biosynthesis acetyltransferase WcaF
MINSNTHTGPSFSLKNRLKRVLWNTICLILFKYSPAPFHAWRRFILRLFGAKIGSKVHVYGKVKIWAPWNLHLGDYCGIGDGVNLYSQDKIYIGKYAVISQGAHLCAGTHDYTKPGFPLLTKPIIIGNYAWIASEAFIHPGVTIGEGTVVGARSVVTADLPEWQICSGFPCKPIKPRVNPYAGR